MPSPRQKVEADAPVPLLRLATGRFPVTPVLNGNPVQLVRVPLAGVASGPPLTSRVPAVPGSVSATVPSAPVGGPTVMVPDVAFRKPMFPTAVPAVPNSSDVVEPASSVVKTPVLGVVPPIAPGAGKLVTLADPSKLEPPIVLVVVSVAADPVVFWLSVGMSPEAMARNAGAPAVPVANRACVVVVEVAATTAVPVNAGRVTVIVPSAPVVG